MAVQTSLDAFTTTETPLILKKLLQQKSRNAGGKLAANHSKSTKKHQ